MESRQRRSRGQSSINRAQIFSGLRPRPAPLIKLCYAGIVFLAVGEAAAAAPIYSCARIGILVDSVSGTVVNTTGQVGCAVVPNGTVSLNGTLDAAAPLGDPTSITSAVYDSAGRLVSDSGTFPTTATYDAVGRLVSETDPQGTTQYHYDSSSRLTSDSGPLGAITATVYDGASRLTSDTDGLGHTTTYTYNALDQLVTEMGPQGTTSYSYNALNQLVTETEPHDTTSYSYDPLGRVTSTTDSLGTTDYFYDPGTGLLDSITDPDGDVTMFHYDTIGRLVGVTDPGGDTSLFFTDVVPEPGSLFLLGAGLAGLLGVAYRRRRFPGSA